MIMIVAMLGIPGGGGHVDPVPDVDDVLVRLRPLPHGLQHVLPLALLQGRLLVAAASLGVPLPDRLVVVAVSLHIRPPEVGELLRNLLRRDLLQLEDEDTGDDDTEDVDEGEDEAEEAEVECLHADVFRVDQGVPGTVRQHDVSNTGAIVEVLRGITFCLNVIPA